MAVASHATVTPHASVTPKSSGSTSAKSGSKAPSYSETSKGTTKSETKAQNGAHSTGKATTKTVPHDFAQHSAANSNMYGNTYKDFNTVGYCNNNAFNTTFPYLWMMNNSNHTTTAETVAPVEESNNMEWSNGVFFCGIVIFFVFFVYLMIAIFRG